MAERGKGFPRISLASAVQIMDAASKFGKSWKKEQFASFGAKNNAGSAKSGAFAARLSALRDYGLIIGDKETVTMTALAERMTKPINAQEREDTIRKAFLSVATFNDLYVSFNPGEALPKDKVAEHAVFNLGVSRDSMDKFVNVFIDAGEYAGLVRYNKEDATITLLSSDDDQSSQSVTTIGISEAADEGETIDFINTSKAISAVKREDFTVGSPMNEQGVNHSGNGWGLTVVVKSSHRLPAELRKAIRDLLESADDVADSFYELEQKGE